ncbi:hypothetical protein NSTC745_02557 [Nostoc sp. DSM 114161]|jgi:hypothetical protein
MQRLYNDLIMMRDRFHTIKSTTPMTIINN